MKEQWIIDKACEASRFYSISCKTVADSRNFIRQLVKEIQEEKSKDKPKLIDNIQSYLLALDALHLAATHLILIENCIFDFKYSKPVNIAHKEITAIENKLKDNFEAWQDKKAIDFDMEFKWRLKNIEEVKNG